MKTFSFLFLIMSSFLRGQNLVPDSSFEVLNVAYLSECYKNNINQSKHWSDIVGNSCIYSLNALNCHPVQPHSGNQYSGYYAFSDAFKSGKSKGDVIQTKLVKPLEKGKTYTISAYIKRRDYSWLAVDRICMSFSSIPYDPKV